MAYEGSSVAQLFARASGVTLAALGLVASLAPYNYHLFAPFAFAIFILSVWRAGIISTTLLTMWAGFVYFLPAVSWLGRIGQEAWIFPALIYAFLSIPVGLGVYFVTRTSLWPIWVSSLWVLRESIVDRFPFGGFGWGQLAYGQVNTPLASYASWGGAQLVTFVTCLIGAMLAYASLWILRYVRERKGEIHQILLAPVVVVLVGLVAFLIPLPAEGESYNGAPSSAYVTIIQGGGESIPGMDPSLSNFPGIFGSHIQLTRDYVLETREKNLPAPDFVIWPEDAAAAQFLTNTDADREMQKLVNYLGRPILAGSGIPTSDGGWANASVLWLPNQGPVDFYVKRHLVPFAEYTPVSGIFWSLLDRFGLSGEYVPGDEPGYFEIDGIAVSTVICFEISAGRVLREAVLAGGRAIVLQSSNYGFIYLGQAEQQFDIARLRAIEHGRTVIASGVSGPSGFIAPNGSVMAVLEEGDIGVISETVPLRDTLTIADRLGGWPEFILALAWVLGIVAFIGRRRVFSRAKEFVQQLRPPDTPSN